MHDHTACHCEECNDEAIHTAVIPALHTQDKHPAGIQEAF